MHRFGVTNLKPCEQFSRKILRDSPRALVSLKRVNCASRVWLGANERTKKNQRFRRERQLRKMINDAFTLNTARDNEYANICPRRCNLLRQLLTIFP